MCNHSSTRLRALPVILAIFSLVEFGIAISFAGADVPPAINPTWMPHSDAVQPRFSERVRESLTRVEVGVTPAAGNLRAAMANVRMLCGKDPSVTFQRSVVVQEFDLPEVQPKGTLLEFAAIGLPLLWRESDGYVRHGSVDCDVLVGERDHEVRYVIGHRQPRGRSFALPPGEKPVRRALQSYLGQHATPSGLTGSLATLLSQAWGHGAPLLWGTYFVVRPIAFDWRGRGNPRGIPEHCALLSVIGCVPDSGHVDPFRGSQFNAVFEVATGDYLFDFHTP